jgi:hypothetical protein
MDLASDSDPGYLSESVHLMTMRREIRDLPTSAILDSTDGTTVRAPGSEHS